jgi:hypothetical protein
MHPRRLEKNANIILKSALLPRAVFRWWDRRPTGSIDANVVMMS